METHILIEGLRQIRHSMIQALVSGNDWRREVRLTHQIADEALEALHSKKFQIGDHVRKISGAAWSGTVVGTYTSSLTAEGYAVESFAETGSVQIYPAAALELISR